MVRVKKRGLIAYKEDRIRDELEIFFRNTGYVVYTAATGEEALEIFFANNHQIDFLIVDMQLKGQGGMEILKTVREYSEVAIFLLAEEFSEEELIDALNKGVDHYILKPVKPRVLKAYIEKVFRRSFGEKKELFCGALKIDQSAQKGYLNNKDLELTPKEYALLSYFVKHSNMVLSREAILDAVWGFDYQGDMRTVDTLIKQLRKKLTPSYPYIQSVYGVGYRFEKNL